MKRLVCRKLKILWQGNQCANQLAGVKTRHNVKSKNGKQLKQRNIVMRNKSCKLMMKHKGLHRQMELVQALTLPDMAYSSTTKRRYFGTDGIRGRVGTWPITPEFVLKLGWAVGKVLALKGHGKVLIGKDTRISGYMFESVLEA